MELLMPGVGIIAWMLFGLLFFGFVIYFMITALRYMRMRLKQEEQKNRL